MVKNVGIMLLRCIKLWLFMMFKSWLPRVLLFLHPHVIWWALKSPMIMHGEGIWENSSEMLDGAIVREGVR